MPLYEYACEKCHSVVEKIQKFSDPPLAVCEKCAGPLVRLMGKPALQFKGSGFYITDYVKKRGESEGKSGSSESKPAESPSSSTPAAAPAASPPAAAPAAAPSAPGAATSHS